MKGRKYLKKENIVFVRERKNREGKGKRYLEKENKSFCREEGKWGKYIVLRRRGKTKREKEDNIWKRKIYILQRRMRTEKEKEENVWRSA